MSNNKKQPVVPQVQNLSEAEEKKVQEFAKAIRRMSPTKGLHPNRGRGGRSRRQGSGLRKHLGDNVWGKPQGELDRRCAELEANRRKNR